MPRSTRTLAERGSKIGYLDGELARALTRKVLSTPAAEVATKENQAIISLGSLTLLHRFFVESRGLPASPAPHAQTALLELVDRRAAPAT